MVSTYHPVTGWSDPEIKPYGPFVLDPVCSCFQYSTNLFEGMKVRLFRMPSIFRRNQTVRRHTLARMARPVFSAQI